MPHFHKLLLEGCTYHMAGYTRIKQSETKRQLLRFSCMVE